jgi:hypothetical protein
MALNSILMVLFSEKLDLKASFPLGTFATFFQAEVYAILACSYYFLKECLSGKTICICSDSRATLMALSSHTASSRLVKLELIIRSNMCYLWHRRGVGLLFYVICVFPTLANLRTQIFGKPILSVSEYEGMSGVGWLFWQFAEKSGRFESRF